MGRLVKVRRQEALLPKALFFINFKCIRDKYICVGAGGSEQTE